MAKSRADLLEEMILVREHMEAVRTGCIEINVRLRPEMLPGWTLTPLKESLTATATGLLQCQDLLWQRIEAVKDDLLNGVGNE